MINPSINPAGMARQLTQIAQQAYAPQTSNCGCQPYTNNNTNQQAIQSPLAFLNQIMDAAHLVAKESNILTAFCPVCVYDKMQQTNYTQQAEQIQPTMQFPINTGITA